MKHTKLPWTTDGSIDGYTCIRSDEKEHAVAWADFDDKDDLAYALVACNNHERLVEALKELYSAWNSGLDTVELDSAMRSRVKAVLLARFRCAGLRSFRTSGG